MRSGLPMPHSSSSPRSARRVPPIWSNCALGGAELTPWHGRAMCHTLRQNRREPDDTRVRAGDETLVILQSLLCLLREKNMLSRADIEEVVRPRGDARGAGRA